MTRLLGAFVTALLAWCGVVQPVQADVATPVAAVAIYTYDAGVGDAHGGSGRSERGPPATAYAYTTYNAGGQRPLGSLVRPDGSSTLVAYNYADTQRLERIARASAEVERSRGHTQAEAVALGRWRVAANGVRSVAPSTFTRAEALSGRASQRTVNEIADSMRANGWQGAPIDVVELEGRRIVVDGHHRLAAARRAGIDVQYQVVDPSSVIGPGRYTSIDDILQSTYSVGRDRLR